MTALLFAYALPATIHSTMTLFCSLLVAMWPLMANETAGQSGTIPWVWIIVGAAVLVITVIAVIAYRAGGDAQLPVSLVVTAGAHSGTELPLRSAFVTIGTERDNDIVVTDDKVSKHHARLTYSKSTLTVTDANSLYGTFVNGERIEKAECQSGDLIRLGTIFECRVVMTKA